MFDFLDSSLTAYNATISAAVQKAGVFALPILAFIVAVALILKITKQVTK